MPLEPLPDVVLFGVVRLLQNLAQCVILNPVIFGGLFPQILQVDPFDGEPVELIIGKLPGDGRGENAIEDFLSGELAIGESPEVGEGEALLEVLGRDGRAVEILLASLAPDRILLLRAAIQLHPLNGKL